MIVILSTGSGVRSCTRLRNMFLQKYKINNTISDGTSQGFQVLLFICCSSALSLFSLAIYLHKQETVRSTYFLLYII